MKGRAFAAVVLSVLLLLSGLGLGGWWLLWQRGPLQLAHHSLAMPRAARFVPASASLSLYLFSDGQRPVDYARAVAPARQRRRAGETIARLRDGAFAAAGLDYEGELAGWLGGDIAMALFEDPVTAATGEAPDQPARGWLLALASRDDDGARRFLQRFWQTRSLAGTDLQVSSYRGMGLISGRGALLGSRPEPLATALVDDDLVLIASGRNLLERSLDVSQIPALNQAGQRALQQGVASFSTGAALVVASPAAVHTWLGLPVLDLAAASADTAALPALPAALPAAPLAGGDTVGTEAAAGQRTPAEKPPGREPFAEQAGDIADGPNRSAGGALVTRTAGARAAGEREGGETAPADGAPPAEEGPANGARAGKDPGVNAPAAELPPDPADGDKGTDGEDGSALPALPTTPRPAASDAGAPQAPVLANAAATSAVPDAGESPQAPLSPTPQAPASAPPAALEEPSGGDSGAAASTEGSGAAGEGDAGAAAAPPDRSRSAAALANPEAEPASHVPAVATAQAGAAPPPRSGWARAAWAAAPPASLAAPAPLPPMLLAVLQPQGRQLELRARLALPGVMTLEPLPAARGADLLEALRGNPSSLALLQNPAQLLQQPLLRPLLERRLGLGQPQARDDGPGPLPALLARTVTGPLLVSESETGWLLGSGAEQPATERLAPLLMEQGLLEAPLDVEGHHLQVWTHLSLGGRPGRQGRQAGADALQAPLSGWREQRQGLAWWGQTLATLEAPADSRSLEGLRKGLQQLDAPEAPLQWSLDGDGARALLRTWQPWRLLSALAGGGLDGPVRGLALAVETPPAQPALELRARLNLGG